MRIICPMTMRGRLGSLWCHKFSLWAWIICGHRGALKGTSTIIVESTLPYPAIFVYTLSASFSLSSCRKLSSLYVISPDIHYLLILAWNVYMQEVIWVLAVLPQCLDSLLFNTFWARSSTPIVSAPHERLGNTINSTVCSNLRRIDKKNKDQSSLLLALLRKVDSFT